MSDEAQEENQEITAGEEDVEKENVQDLEKETDNDTSETQQTEPQEKEPRCAVIKSQIFV